MLGDEDDTHHDGDDRTENDDVARQEGCQTLRTGLNLPRRSCPSTNHSSEERSSLDVDILGSDERKVVRGRDRVGRDVGTESGETKGEGAEESPGSVFPQHDDLRGVPVQLAVDRLSGRCDSDSDEGEGPVDQGDEEELPP